MRTIDLGNGNSVMFLDDEWTVRLDIGGYRRVIDLLWHEHNGLMAGAYGPVLASVFERLGIDF